MSWVRVWLDCFQIDSEWTGEWPVEIDPEWVFYQKVFNLEVLKPHLLWMNLSIKTYTNKKCQTMRNWLKENKIHTFSSCFEKKIVCPCIIWQILFDLNLRWQSKILWSNVTCGQKSRSQMSLVVKSPGVKCHLWSEVPPSNVTCGQKSRAQM